MHVKRIDVFFYLIFLSCLFHNVPCSTYEIKNQRVLVLRHEQSKNIVTTIILGTKF